MKTFETTTNIVFLVNVGTYWGPFEYEKFWMSDENYEHEQGNFVCNDYDFAKFKKAIVEEVNKVLEEHKPFKDYGVVSIKATNMGSPKEYNFGDDWLDLEVTVEDDFLDRAEKAIFDPKYREMLDEFARNEWQSRDGYISSMTACSLDGMHKVFENIRKGESGRNDMRDFGSVLALLKEIEVKEGRMVHEADCDDGSLSWEVVTNFQENHTLGEFCTILYRDDAQKLYPGVALMDAFDDAEKQLDEGLEKYRKSGVPDEAVEKCEKEVRSRKSKIDDYRKDLRWAVEGYHPKKDKVDENIAKVKEKWEAEFGECPTRATLGNLPNQEALPV